MVREAQPLNVSETRYVNGLQMVFPTSPAFQLNCLAVWTVIDLYLEKERTFSIRKNGPRIRDFGPIYRNTTFSQSTKHVHLRSGTRYSIFTTSAQPPYNELGWRYNLTKRARNVQVSKYLICRRLLEAMGGNWHEDLEDVEIFG